MAALRDRYCREQSGSRHKATRLYEGSGHDLLMVRDGLGHRSVAVTQRYLSVRRAELDALILKSDWMLAAR